MTMDTLTNEELTQGYMFKTNYIGMDSWSRETYTHPSGRTYALFHGRYHP